MREITIGGLAGAVGVNVQTVRYYERRRLLEPALRRESGYRVYHEDAARKLRFIKNAQELGFTLEEIRSLLDLRGGQSVNCEKVRRKASAHAQDIKKRITRLRSMDRVLQQLIKTCRRRGQTDECPILRSLEAKK